MLVTLPAPLLIHGTTTNPKNSVYRESKCKSSQHKATSKEPHKNSDEKCIGRKNVLAGKMVAKPWICANAWPLIRPHSYYKPVKAPCSLYILVLYGNHCIQGMAQGPYSMKPTWVLPGLLIPSPCAVISVQHSPWYLTNTCTQASKKEKLQNCKYTIHWWVKTCLVFPQRRAFQPV